MTTFRPIVRDITRDITRDVIDLGEGVPLVDGEGIGLSTILLAAAGVGFSIAAAAGSADISFDGAAVSGYTIGVTGSSDLSLSATAAGESIAAAAGSASLSLSPAAVSETIVGSDGSAAFSFAGAGVGDEGETVTPTVGSSSFSIGVSGVGISTAEAVGAASLSLTPSGVIEAITPAAGSSAITFTASAVGGSLKAAAGSASFSFTDGAVGASTYGGAGSSAIALAGAAVGISTNAAAGSSAFSYDVQAVAGPIAAGAGSAAASVTGTAVASSYTEELVLFDGTETLTRGGLGSVTNSSDGVLYGSHVFDGDPTEGACFFYCREASGDAGSDPVLEVYMTGGKFALYFASISGVYISEVGTTVFEDGDRVNWFVTFTEDTVEVIVNGTVEISESVSSATWPWADQSFWDLFIYNTEILSVEQARYAFWAGATFDPTSSTVRDKFYNSGTGVTVNPATSVADYGAADFDIYGSSATQKGATNDRSGSGNHFTYTDTDA
jgi:hypothetical protein